MAFTESVDAYKKALDHCGDEELYALTWKKDDVNVMKLWLGQMAKKRICFIICRNMTLILTDEEWW